MRPLKNDTWIHNPLRNLLRMLDVGWLRGVCVFLVFIFKTSPVLLFPLFVEHVIEVLTGSAPESIVPVLWPALGLILLQLSNVPAHTLYIHLISRHIRGAEQKLRSALIRQLQYMSIRFYHSTQSGELQAKVLRDVEQVELLLRSLLTRGFQIILTVCFAVTVTLVKEPLVRGFYVIAAPFSVGIIRVFRRRLRERNEHFRQEVEDMSSSVSEMIDMIPVTKAHGLEEKEIDRVEANLQRIHRKGQRLDRMNGVFESSSYMTMQITQVICLIFTGTLCVRGVISVSELVLYQTLFGLIVQSLAEILNLVPQLSKGMVSLQSLGQVLSSKDLESGEGRVRPDRIEGRVAFEQVGYSYGDDWAVRGVSFQAEPGDCIAFVGESGSGKSTLMNLAIGFFQPQEGRILLEGVDQTDLDLYEWRRRLAVVPQTVLLFSGSLRENICYGVGEPSDARLREVLHAAHLETVVESLPEGLDTPIGENGVRLSGGQRQRIAIARALMRDPQVIILDEATSALDVISEREVQLAIDALVKGRTTFIVAHRLSTIRQANHIVVMKDGRIIEQGSQEALLAADGEFARLKALQ
jgi:ATP-binding cassette subfamily B protein